MRLPPLPISPPGRLFLLLFLYLTYRSSKSFIRYAIKLHDLRRSKKLKFQQKQSQIAILQKYDPRSLDELSATESNILALSPNELINSIKSKRFTLREILITCCRQTLRLDLKHQCVSEYLFSHAFQNLENLEYNIKSNPELIENLPLLGLPVSIKDSVNVKNFDTTLGLVGYTNQPASNTALVVEILEQKGALIYCKSNVPQTLLSFECSNFLFGRTTNLVNEEFTCGGSSGGESVLLCGRASLIGIGTDIGGSVRLPAHFQGCCSLKLTSRRLSTLGLRPSVPGQETVPGVACMMSRSVDGLKIVEHLVCEEAFAGDHELMPLRFRREIVEDQRPLRIGYYCHDGVVWPSPPVIRAINQTIDLLRSNGHKVEVFHPPCPLEGIKLYYALMTADGGKTMTNQLKKDFWEDYVKFLVKAVRSPLYIRKVIAFLLQLIYGQNAHSLIEILTQSHERSVTELWKLQYKKKIYKQRWYEAFKSSGFDVLICPVHPLPAPPHHSYKKISFTASYTMIFNVLDWAAGSLPVTNVQSTDIIDPNLALKHNTLLDRMSRKYYSVEKQLNLPISIQIVAPSFNDETVLRAMSVIEKLTTYNQQKLN